MVSFSVTVRIHQAGTGDTSSLWGQSLKQPASCR